MFETPELHVQMVVPVAANFVTLTPRLFDPIAKGSEAVVFVVGVAGAPSRSAARTEPGVVQECRVEICTCVFFVLALILGRFKLNCGMFLFETL